MGEERRSIYILNAFCHLPPRKHLKQLLLLDLAPYDDDHQVYAGLKHFIDD
jgi:hypothetical protein